LFFSAEHPMNGYPESRRATVRVALTLLALAGAPVVVTASQTLIADQSEVIYLSSQMGAQVEGSFGRFEAKIDLDPDRLQTSSVSLAVDTSSVIFPSSDVQKELAKPDWLDTAHYPKAEFRSSRMRTLGGDRYEIAGTLTIKGHARDVVVPVSLSRSGATTFATGTLTIKRLDYGVGVGEWGDTSLVADDVQIRFKIAMRGASSG
jgi:polyisoprenoid-binding protein YceI